MNMHKIVYLKEYSAFMCIRNKKLVTSKLHVYINKVSISKIKIFPCQAIDRTAYHRRIVFNSNSSSIFNNSNFLF